MQNTKHLLSEMDIVLYLTNIQLITKKIGANANGGYRMGNSGCDLKVRIYLI